MTKLQRLITYSSYLLGTAAIAFILWGVVGVAFFLHAVDPPRPIPQLTPAGGELLSNERLVSQQDFTSLPDLTYWRGHWYACCRSSSKVGRPLGSIRVYRSSDFNSWERVPQLEIPGSYRSPHFLETVDGELALNAARVTGTDEAAKLQTVLFRSADGETWSGPEEVAEPNMWLWRIRRRGRSLFGVGYSTDLSREKFIRLYRSDDNSRSWAAVSDPVKGNDPNETELLFEADGTLRLLVRRDSTARESRPSALLATAKPPYQQWQLQDREKRFACPNLTRLSDGRILAGGRFYQPNRVSLAWLDLKTARLTEFCCLAVAENCGYPGVVVQGDIAHVVYHTEDDRIGGTHLYAARVRLPRP